MSLTGRITQSITIDGATPQQFTVERTDEGRLPYINAAVPAAQANKEYDIAIDISQLKLLHISATKDCTLKTNSSGSPIDTLILKAGEPVQWWNNSVNDCPLTADVTKVYITNVDALTLVIDGITDPTP